MQMSKKKMNGIILVMSLFLMLFSAILNIMSYRRMLAESYVHASNLNTVGVVRKLEYAIGFGKPLDKFYGLDTVLSNTLQLSDYILGIEVCDKNGNTVEQTGNIMEHPSQSSSKEEYIIAADGIYSFVDFEAGQIILRLDKAEMTEEMYTYVCSVAKVGMGLFLTIVVCLICFSFIRKNDGISVRQLKVTSLILLITAQLGLGAYVTYYAVHAYQDSTQLIAESAVRVVQSDVNEVLEKGMAYSELKQVDQYLNHLCEDISEFSNMKIISDKGTSSLENVYKLELKDQKSPVVQMKITMNTRMVQKKILNHVIDIFIIIMVTIFVSLEVIGYITGHLEQKGKKKTNELYFPGFRLFVFVSGLAFSLDSGFVSVLSTELYGQMGLPENMTFLSGMPNAMFSLAVVLGLFGCSFLISRFGVRKTLYLGVGMGVLGSVLCSVAASLPVFIVARFIFGFCDGLVINTIRLFASSQKEKEMHNKILVTYFAAMNLGVCCSVVIGGLVADVTSYAAVFILGAVLGIFCLCLIHMSGFSNEKNSSKMSFTSAIGDLRYGKVLIFMLFIVVPLYISPLFVEYTFPIFGDEIGFSNSLVSGCLTINYLIIAYLTDPISDWVNKYVKPRKAIVCYVLLQAASIGIFVVFANVWAAILALILTSLWDCFGMVVIDSVLDDVKETTTEKSTLLQMIFGKAGMVIGPVIVTARLDGGAARATGSIVVILLAGVSLYLVCNSILTVKAGKNRR